MKMSKSLKLFSFAAALLLLVLAFWCLRGNGTGEADFAVKDPEKIGKIFLADRENNTILLERKGPEEWLLNESYKADRAAVDELLRTLRLMTVKAPVADAARENVIKGMAVKNIRVEIFDRKGKLIKAFFIGAPVERGSGNYMLMDGSDELYVVHIPGLNAMLHTRFFTEMPKWRDREVFHFEPGSIRRVEVDYPVQPDQSFAIEVYRRDSFALYPLHREEKEHARAEKRIIARYLNAFSEVNAEAYLNSYSKKDSILSQGPYAVIRVEDSAGSAKQISLFYKPIDKRTKMLMDSSGRYLPFDRERSYALINNDKDFVLIQHFVFGKLLMRYDYFFKAGEEDKKNISN